MLFAKGAPGWTTFSSTRNPPQEGQLPVVFLEVARARSLHAEPPMSRLHCSASSELHPAVNRARGSRHSLGFASVRPSNRTQFLVALSERCPAWAVQRLGGLGPQRPNGWIPHEAGGTGKLHECGVVAEILQMAQNASRVILAALRSRYAASQRVISVSRE